MGTIHSMNRAGDSQFSWDPTVPAEVKHARGIFDEAIRQGFPVFRVRGRGAKGERLHDFEPEAERLIVVPAMMGGQ